MSTITKPHYKRGIMPDSPTIEMLHRDVETTMDHILGDIDLVKMFDKESIDAYQQKYKGVKLILKSDLDKLVSFWGLEMGATEKYVGSIPFSNQEDIYDFFSSFKEGLEVGRPIIVSTPDLWDNLDDLISDIDKKTEQIINLKIEHEKKMLPTLDNDPIVLWDLGKVEMREGPKEGIYAIVTAWGKEKELI